MKYWTRFLALILLTSMGACSSEGVGPGSEIQNAGTKVTSIDAIIGDLQYEGSRTSVTMGSFTDNSIRLVWADKDTIGIYPEEGDQLSFPIVEGVGTNKCTFNGGGWALKTSTSYKAYSPFNRAYYYGKAEKLPVSMLGQKQTGNGNAGHLGRYDLQIAQGKTPSEGKITFGFKHQVCFLRMDLTAPVDASWKSVSLESDAKFTTRAVMDLNSEAVSLTGTSASNRVTLGLEGVKTEAGETVTAYMVVLPVNLTGKTLDVILTDADDNEYRTQAVIANDYRNFKAGYARWIKAEDFPVGKEDIPYVTFKADAAQSFTMTEEVPTLEYSVDDGDWKELGVNVVEFGGELGDLQIRGKSEKGTAEDKYEYSSVLFGTDVRVSCSGDIRTLVDYENYKSTSTNNARFCGLFYNCRTLTSAPDLPITNLAAYCYIDMFKYCSSLTEAPELPATTLSTYCYSSMFSGCSSLAVAPELPATALALSCYHSMFEGCVSLIEAPGLPAVNLGYSCYQDMFKGCSSLEAAPELPAVKLTPSCYSDMFNGCTSLSRAPELPAIYLETFCYARMFSGCESLTVAPVLPAATLHEYCYERMFQDCISLSSAPVLAAKYLTKSCYSYMFSSCEKLQDVTMLATDISADGCLSGWLHGVSTSGTFTKAKDMTSLPVGKSGIPEGWTVVEE